MSDSPVVGIDLGTTHSLVAVLRDGRPTLIRNVLGERLTPSCVSVDDDGRVLVGAAAKARLETHPRQSAGSFKRDMGTDRVRVLGGDSFTAPALSAMVLQALRQDAEALLGCEVREAVVTVPAYFGDAQRQATRDAGALVGLKVERIINEPTAAALAYGLDRLDEELTAVVIDLGGGTFDVTVLEILEGVIEVRGSAGDTRLGGDDFDEALRPLIEGAVQARIGRPPGQDLETRARLRAAAERAKRALSTDEAAPIELPRLRLDDGSERDVTIEVARSAATTAWQPLVQRLEGPIRRALRDAECPVAEVERVLLVGGATRMPLVGQLARRIFGRFPDQTLPPDEAVALGAAVQAGLKSRDAAVSDVVVTDIAPFTMGVSVGARHGNRVLTGMFSPIIERGTVIPVSRVETYFPLEERQTEVKLDVYQGEHPRCADNEHIGTYTLKGLPKQHEADRSFEVRFTYDLNGILEVETTVNATGDVHTMVIERGAGRLSEAAIREARAAMKTLKIHPRDTLPNRTALARAEALYVELTGPARAQLGEVIAAFSAALEAQDDAAIPELRALLEGLVARLG